MTLTIPLKPEVKINCAPSMHTTFNGLGQPIKGSGLSMP